MGKKEKYIFIPSTQEMPFAIMRSGEQARSAPEESVAQLTRLVFILRSAIESTRDGLLVTDENGDVLYCNQLYRDMWSIQGRPGESEEHRSLIRHCSRYLKEPEKFVQSTENIYATWPIESFDVLEFLDGRTFERYTKMNVAGGENVGRVWSFRDITEHLRADTYQAQLAAIVEHSNDAIIAKDFDGIITGWNGAAERIFGYRANEIIGHPITALLPPDRLEEESRIMSLIRKGKVTEHFDTVRWAKGQKPIDVSVTMSPVKDSTDRIIGVSKIVRDITQRKESQERIEYLAHHDVLTGLPNRALLGDRMNVAIANADRYARRLGLLFLDLDHFKLINDSLGHGVGDELLKLVAKRMLSIVRRADTVSRRGGDEFIVLLSQLETPDDAKRVSEKLLAALSEPYTVGPHELTLTSSIGISIYPDHGEDAAALLRHADTAMYSAKENSKNRYEFYINGSAPETTEGLELERDLRHALRGEEPCARPIRRL